MRKWGLPVRQFKGRGCENCLFSGLRGRTALVELLDLMMPVMDGFAVLERVRGPMGLMHLPILILTAKGEAEAQSLALETGADDYLTKPFAPAVLKARIKALLRRSEYRAP